MIFAQHNFQLTFASHCYRLKSLEAYMSFARAGPPKAAPARVVIKMNDFLIGIALLHLVIISYIVAAAPNMERVVLLVTISLKGSRYNYSAGLSRLRELLQWIR